MNSDSRTAMAQAKGALAEIGFTVDESGALTNFPMSGSDCIDQCGVVCRFDEALFCYHDTSQWLAIEFPLNEAEISVAGDEDGYMEAVFYLESEGLQLKVIRGESDTQILLESKTLQHELVDLRL